MTANLAVVDALPPTAILAPSKASSPPGSRAVHDDPRWRLVVDALTALRGRRRHAVRIVDADCGCGTLLIAAARQARVLGFTAIEARGVDGSPALIGRARAAAARVRDPAIGIAFDLADMAMALAEEADAPADIVLWHGARVKDRREGVAAALAAAADMVIGDPMSAIAGRRAG